MPANTNALIDEPYSTRYWEKRYADGSHSGAGSYGKFAEFKAGIINAFIAEHGIESVVEFGCGDGAQLALATYASYVGYDVSDTVLAAVREKFKTDPSKSFRSMREPLHRTFDTSLSLDVIYHLLEDETFENYMTALFAASHRFVIIYSSNRDENAGFENTHVWHRVFTDWVGKNRPEWQLTRTIPNIYPYLGDHRTGTFADFYIYERRAAAPGA